jgi:hypothetical protein
VPLNQVDFDGNKVMNAFAENPGFFPPSKGMPAWFQRKAEE